MNVKHILATKGSSVITVSPRQTVAEALDLLVANNIGAVVVVEAEKLVGILSERDIIRRAAHTRTVFALPVAKVMTKDPITGLPQDDIRSVANTMTQKRFRHLPIVDDGKLVGIVSIGDVVKAQRDTYRGKLDTMETQLMAE